ncbi:MAG TPA: hydroxymethylbilane synthase [Thermomicrobiales bacterium]|nr:hydroxymethylbilane synthase [Thermomicrobiales bacterium]
MTGKTLTIGTRGSALALRQAEMVVASLREVHPNLGTHLRVFKPLGDRDKASPLRELGGQGVFVREIEHALAAGEIDVAIHSLKDLSGELPAGLTLAAITRREDARDVLISRHGLGWRDLPADATVGTSSPRRAVQLRALRPDFRIADLRGNVDTRLRKAQDPPYDAIVLAAVGLQRMGWEDRVTQYLDPAECLPMVGQGARAVEARADDAATLALLAPLDDGPTRLATSAERAFLRRLGAGCRAAVAAYATLDGDRLTIAGLIGDPGGADLYRTTVSGRTPTIAAAEALGDELAADLLARGGDRLVAAAIAQAAG